ncbi:MAG: hypothetical protein NTV38_06360 [Chloroflexi bacterium]|nr:hypothetical protein [Chloroflexota bacterium]
MSGSFYGKRVIAKSIINRLRFEFPVDFAHQFFAQQQTRQPAAQLALPGPWMALAQAGTKRI